MKTLGKHRKICVVVNSRANYGRVKTVMEAISQHPSAQLQLIVGASALLFRFGKVVDMIEDDGFVPDARLYSIVEGENPVTMAKSTGLAITELATLFENLRPDIVLTVADRFETLATAVAASYMNIVLAHTQGGEITGSIDESVRHAITKLAHIHFPATKNAAMNVERMGENPKNIFNLGCPSIDLIANLDLENGPDIFDKYRGKGSGPLLDPGKPYLVVLQHPVTTEYGSGLEQINQTLKAVSQLGMQTAWLWPNVDAGSDEISKGLRMYRDSHREQLIHFYHNFEVVDYAWLIYNSACLIGNSSSAIREGAFLGVPSVNIGTRQNGREHGNNVLFTDYRAEDIVGAVKKQIEHGRYSSSNLFGDGTAGKKIAQILSDIDVSVQKRLTY